MSGFLDTSVLVRYLTNDPPTLAAQAERIIDGTEELRLTGVVLAETAHVLGRVYQIPRATIVDLLIDFLHAENVTVDGPAKNTVIQGLLLCRPSGRVSFADALIWATIRTTDTRVVYTFDTRFPADGVEVRQGPV